MQRRPWPSPTPPPSFYRPRVEPRLCPAEPIPRRQDGARQLRQAVHGASPSQHLVEADDGDDGCVRKLEQPDATAAKGVVAAQHEPPGPKHQQREQVERRIKVREAVARRGFQHIHAVDVDVFDVRFAHDAREAVGEQTGQRAHEEKRGHGDEDNHERRAKHRVNPAHYFKADVAGAEKDLAEDAGHLEKREVLAAKDRKCGEKPAIDDDNDDHELDKVHGHLFQTRNQNAPGRIQRQERTHPRYQEESLKSKYIERKAVYAIVLLYDSGDS